MVRASTLLASVLIPYAVHRVSCCSGCYGNILKDCDCTTERICEEDSWGTFEKCCCTYDGEFCRIRSNTCQDDERELGQYKCPRADKCTTKQDCVTTSEEECENGCNEYAKRCVRDSEVCGTQWSAAAAGAMCDASGLKNLPSGYLSWKDIMTTDADVSQQRATDEVAWFDDTVRTLVTARTICNPADSSQCFTGTIPDELQSDTFFSQTGTQSFSAENSPDSLYTATVDLSTCRASWDSYVCMRNFPECAFDQPASAKCYDECKGVSACLDAYLLWCLVLNATANTCDGFDWAPGATCDPGFACHSLVPGTIMFAILARNCDGPSWSCEDRPHVMAAGSRSLSVLRGCCSLLSWVLTASLPRPQATVSQATSFQTSASNIRSASALMLSVVPIRAATCCRLWCRR
eukprot:457600-Rhodomonas_salina.2